MQKTIALAAAILVGGTPLVLAQMTTPPSPPPTEKAPAPSATPAPPAASAPATDLVLTNEQAQALIGKAVYSSDGKNLGEVAAFARDGSNRVTELHADVGGFLGIGETRVRVMPAQFAVRDDRIQLLNINADQAKSLPPIAKK